jgi:hypothetical protein
LSAVQTALDQQEAALKSHARTTDEKLHNMEWSLEYAKDAAFKQDAHQIRSGAAAAPPPNPSAHAHTPAPTHHAAPSPSHQAVSAKRASGKMPPKSDSKEPSYSTDRHQHQIDDA